VRLQAAECSQLRRHFRLQTTPTTSEVWRCRSSSQCPPSCLTRQTLRNRDVVQSPFTVDEVDLCGRRPPLLTKAHGSLRSFSLTGKMFYRFSVTLLVFSRADHSTLQVLTTFYVVFMSIFYWRLASKAFKLIRPTADWSTAVISHAAVNSDARSIQISSQNIRICRFASMQAAAVR